MKLHHAVADGLAAVALMASLFDEGQDDSKQGSRCWNPNSFRPTPACSSTGLSARIRGIARMAAGIAHPISRAREFRLKAGIAGGC